MYKIIITLGLFLLLFSINCCEKESQSEPTGFEGSYISDYFIYPSLGIKTNLILEIRNGLADNDVKSIQMRLMYSNNVLRSIKINSVVYSPQTGKVPAYINIEFDFVDDPECGIIDLSKYNDEIKPLCRLTGMINAYKDDEFGSGAMYTWAERLYFYH